MFTPLLYHFYFNSRPHKEVDLPLRLTTMQRLNISTHDLTRRSTTRGQERNSEDIHFNSRPHKEVDELPLAKHVRIIYFNSRPHKEVDDELLSISPNRTDFNSRPHKEVDLR